MNTSSPEKNDVDLNGNAIKNIRHIFEDYIQNQESTASNDDKDLMTQSLKTLEIVKDKSDLELLINVWMYYDPTDYVGTSEIYRILGNSKPESIEAIKRRIHNKKDWENENSAPYSDLTKLLMKINSM
jgi:hypothetical protein